MGMSKSITQCKKEEAKVKMGYLANKRKKEVTDKVQVERNTTQQAEKKTRKIEHGSNKRARSSSPGQKKK